MWQRELFNHYCPVWMEEWNVFLGGLRLREHEVRLLKSFGLNTYSQKIRWE